MAEIGDEVAEEGGGGIESLEVCRCSFIVYWGLFTISRGPIMKG